MQNIAFFSSSGNAGPNPLSAEQIFQDSVAIQHGKMLKYFQQYFDKTAANSIKDTQQHPIVGNLKTFLLKVEQQWYNPNEASSKYGINVVSAYLRNALGMQQLQDEENNEELNNFKL